MRILLRRCAFFFLLPICFPCCTTQKATTGNAIPSLRFLGEFDLPHRIQFQGTTVGGLSSIDYNKKKDEYYLICDDRSDINPARFYTAKIAINKSGIDTVQLTAVNTLLNAKGEVYPNRKQDSLHVPDPEALRYNPTNNTLVWSSEGERIVQENKTLLEDPAIYVANLQGQTIDSFPLPANLHMQAAEKGPRRNGVLEGLTFSPDYKTLYASVEEPLYEDGPRAGLGDTSGWIRIIRYNVATKQPVAQYAYRIDPVAEEPVPKGAFIVNGVPDILAINEHQLLVTERSFSTGKPTCNVRVYLAELNGAASIAGVQSLERNPSQQPIRKTLLLNMSSLNRWIDNVEGATFGPVLPNGRKTVLFVTDDNFAPGERTQFFLFEIQ